MNIIHAHIKVKPEYRDAFLEQVKELVKQSQVEEGNISYQLYENTELPNAFVMLEEWKDASAIEFHNQTTHYKEFGKVAKDFLLEPPQVVKYEVSSKNR
jgi:quinol monooxygenase YgiN